MPFYTHKVEALNNIGNIDRFSILMYQRSFLEWQGKQLGN